MSESPPPARWHLLSGTVQGPSHVRNQKRNQDFCEVLHQGECVIAAVADGHGSEKCYKSDLGSRFATVAAIDTLCEFAERLKLDDSPIKPNSLPNDADALEVAERVAATWRGKVDENLAIEPIAEAYPVLAYGTTVAAALVTPTFALYLQLGDGDIVLVDRRGVRRPLPPDPRSFANETASLARPTPGTNRPGGGYGFRARAISHRGLPPALVLLSTDGYANSFATDADFLKAAADLHALCRDAGPEAVRVELPDWLAESARKTGDDVSVAVLYREELPPPQPELSDERVETRAGADN